MWRADSRIARQLQLAFSVIASTLGILSSVCAATPNGAEFVLERGRAIFDGRANDALSIEVGGFPVPAEGTSCAGCHGGDGRGGSETGSGRVITPDVLTMETADRPAYDEASLRRAITVGIRPDGTPVSSGMPRFSFAEPADLDALIAYLAVIDREGTPGLDATTLRLGLRDGPVSERNGLFARAFRETLAQRAPRGVAGRQMVIVTQPPFFVRIGGRLPVEHGGDRVPTLFADETLVGDEDPMRVRGLDPGLASRIAALMEAHPQGGLVVAGPLAARLEALFASRLDGSWRIVEAETEKTTKDQATTSRILVVDGERARTLRQLAGPAVHSMADTLIPLLIERNGDAVCVTSVSAHGWPRPGHTPTPPVSAEPPASVRGSLAPAIDTVRGRLAAQILIKALVRCGHDCTTTALMRAFDELRTSEYDEVKLDYSHNRLTGRPQPPTERSCR